MNSTSLSLALFLAVGMSFAPCVAQTPPGVRPNAQPFADFFVSPGGNDRWSGKLAEPNADSTDGPFATLGRARQAVRVLKAGLTPEFPVRFDELVREELGSDYDTFEHLESPNAP